MKNIRKALSMILAIAMIFILSACNGNNGNNEKAIKTDDGVFVLKNENSVELGTPEKTIDPQYVYDNLEYTPEMFYGRYCIHDWLYNKDSGDMDQFRSNIDFMDDPYSDDDIKISKLPYFFEAGIETSGRGLKYETKYNWVSLSFAIDTGYSKDYQFSYEIDGNKIKLTKVNWEFDNETRKLKYEFDESVKLEYEFSFSGRALILSKDGKSVTLYSGLTYSGEEDYLYSSNYVTLNSAILDTITKISFRWKEEDGSSIYFEYTDEDGSTRGTTNGIAELSENGLFTFTIPYDTGSKTYQFVCFLCNDDGIILTDGINTYYYMDSYSTFTKGKIENNVDIEQLDTLNEMSEAELEKLEEKKTDLFEDLTTAFNDAGISVNVNKATGEIAMDSTILFGGDSAELTNDGKEFLNKFVKAYTSIIYNEKYDDFISKTMVEGHIAPVSGTTYESGMPLSEKRAKNVMDYCLSSETGVDTSKLADTMETIGYSQSRPVYDSDGNVDFAASRRVSFRFIINLDN